jgi:hypothetical protein
VTDSVAWLKGNLHTHTNLSDGDSPPLEVARWYADHGYDFLVLTDHNLRVDPTPLQRTLDREGRRLLLIPGEELTSWWEGVGRVHAIHVGGIGTTRTLGPSSGDSVVEALQMMIDRVGEGGGLAAVNHPNFWDSISAADLAGLERVSHFEVFNGHPAAANQGSTRLPPLEETWDLLLSQGKRMFGFAVDDAHDFSVFGPEYRNPGRGWVAVESPRRSPGPIMSALRAGRFYSSTGPEMGRFAVRRGRLEVETRGDGLVEFIAGGRVVATSPGPHASHPLPAQGYLRARLREWGGTAWTQPAFGGEG